MEDDDSLTLSKPPDITTGNVQKYRYSGFFLVDIGLVISDRFKIILKLGFGGYSTVWLACDQTFHRYVALKIVLAERSEAYESVFPVLGPTLSNMALYNCRLFPDVAKKFARQVAVALDTLHSSGFCHGDLTPDNIALQLSKSFDSLSEDDIYDIFGEPLKEPIQLVNNLHFRRNVFKNGAWKIVYTPPKLPKSRSKRRSIAEKKKTGPIDLVHSINLTLLPTKYLSGLIFIANFDQTYLAQDPPRRLSGIPAGFLAPKAIFELRNGPPADIWAFGCCLFLLRAAINVFSDMFPYPTNTACLIYCTLGPFPDKWKKVPFDEDGWPLHGEDRDEDAPGEFDREFHIKPRSITQLLEQNVRDPIESESSDRSYPWWAPTLSRIKRGNFYTRGIAPGDATPISPEELGCFSNLLQSIFTYNPKEERP